MSTSLDITWLFIVITIAVLWSLAIAVWWERSRRYGTLHTRACLRAAIRDRDEARRQVVELSTAIADAVGHPIGLPRPGKAGRPAGAAQAPASPAAEAHLHVVPGGTR